MNLTRGRVTDSREPSPPIRAEFSPADAPTVSFVTVLPTAAPVRVVLAALAAAAFMAVLVAARAEGAIATILIDW